MSPALLTRLACHLLSRSLPGAPASGLCSLLAGFHIVLSPHSPGPSRPCRLTPLCPSSLPAPQFLLLLLPPFPPVELGQPYPGRTMGRQRKRGTVIPHEQILRPRHKRRPKSGKRRKMKRKTMKADMEELKKEVVMVTAPSPPAAPALSPQPHSPQPSAPRYQISAPCPQPPDLSPHISAPRPPALSPQASDLSPQPPALSPQAPAP